MAHSFTFNGTDLSTYGVLVKNYTLPLSLSAGTIQLQSKAYAGTSQRLPGILTLDVMIFGATKAGLRTYEDTIRGVLAEQEDCELTVDMISGYYWNARCVEMNGARIAPETWAGTIIFACNDPLAYDTSDSLQNETTALNASASYGGIIRSVALDPDGEYVYIAGLTTQTVRKLSMVDLSLVAESADYGGSIFAICCPTGDYVYCAGATTLKVQQLLKSDLTVNAEGPSYGVGTDIYAIADYGDYIYYGGDGGAGQYDVVKLDKATMSVEVRGPDYGGSIFAIAANSTHVFAGGSSLTGRVRRYLITDMSYVDQSDDYGGNIQGVAVDSTNCYWCGDLDEVWYAPVGNLANETQSADLGGNLKCITVDDDYIYTAGDDNVVYKLDIAFTAADSYIAKSADYGGDIYAIAIDEYLFIGGDTTQTCQKLDTRHLPEKADYDISYAINSVACDDNYVYIAAEDYRIHKLRKYDLALIARSPSYGGTITQVAVDNDDIAGIYGSWNNYVYCAGATTQTVWKLSKDDLSFVDETADYGASIRALYASGGYIYYGGNNNAGYFLKKALYSTMVVAATSGDLLGDIYAVVRKGDNVYVGGVAAGPIDVVYDLSTAALAQNDLTPDLGGDVSALDADATDVYAGANGSVSKFTRGALNAGATATSVATGGVIWAVKVDDTYCYFCGAGVPTVAKLLNTDLTTISYLSSLIYNYYGLAIDDGYIYYGGNDTICHKLDKRVLWQRSDYEFTITSSGTANADTEITLIFDGDQYTGFTIINETTGETFVWEGTGLDTETIVIDSALCYMTLEDETAMSGQSGDWIHLAPGANVIRIEDFVGDVQVAWTDRYA